MDQAEPSERDRALVDEMLHIRGTIVMNFSQIEFVLLDLVVQIQMMQAYTSPTFSVPYKLKDRLRIVRGLADQPGPLAPYQNEIHDCLDRFEEFKEIRNTMAHGCTQFGRDESAKFTFRVFRWKSKTELHQDIFTIPINALRVEFHRIIMFTTTSLQMFGRIYNELGLDRPWEQPEPPAGATQIA